MRRFTGSIVDVVAGRVFPGHVEVEGERITRITEDPAARGPYLMPGFVDAHVHVESSLLPPSEFARLAVTHGTAACVSDPHEIANVCGLEGISAMQRDAANAPMRFVFGVPSCVPATGFETSGAVIDAATVTKLLDDPAWAYLSEVMNHPGVLSGDAEVLAKIAAAVARSKPVDGHAPGLRGDDARRYAAAGITTDHECASIEEARDKLDAGMSILIREGSAAKNYEALHPLLDSHPGRVMLCSDDKHPDDLAAGHINALVRRALHDGHDLFDALRAATLTPARHYDIPCGLLRHGDPADLLVVDDLDDLKVRETWLRGALVARDGRSLLPRSVMPPINAFGAAPIAPDALRVEARSTRVKAIVARDGQLITGASELTLDVTDSALTARDGDDVAKLAVLNRYRPAAPSVAFVRGFGIYRGAIASSVSHDSHNVIAVGRDDASLARAINAVVAMRGGLALVDGAAVRTLPLPIAGLMSDGDGWAVARDYAAMSEATRALGSTLRAPWMTLSFMALLVIPSLKLSDRGLFDGDRFAFTSVYAS